MGKITIIFSLSWSKTLEKYRLFKYLFSYYIIEVNQSITHLDTWSHTIMGNDRAEELWDHLFDIAYSYATEEEFKKYHREVGDSYPHEFYRVLINRSFEELVEFVFKDSSRLAFQVLGVFIINKGASMPEDIRELILAHSEWEDERDKIDDDKDRVERKKWLLDFQERVRNYVEGIPVKVPHETRRDVYRKNKSRIRLYIERRQVRKNTKRLFKK